MADSRRFALGNQLGNKVLFLVRLPAKKKKKKLFLTSSFIYCLASMNWVINWINCYDGYADIEQILIEAQHRWLRPAEICEILRNYTKFRIAPESPHTPPSMLFFVQFYFIYLFYSENG